jgi:hypothetical protein
MNQFEKDCYGISTQAIREEYMNSITASLGGQEMVVMSILSDAQYLMELEDTDQARKLINVAKFILGEQLKTRRRSHLTYSL